MAELNDSAPLDNVSDAPISSSETTSQQAKALGIRRWPKLWRIFAAVSGTVWLLGLMIRFTVNDGYDLTAPVFYALPVPVLACCGIVCAESLRKLGRRRIPAVIHAAVAVHLAIWLPNVLHFRAEKAPPGVIRLLFWNVNRGNLGYKEIARDIVSYNPDLVCLVEATGAGQQEALWAPLLPGYRVRRLGSAMLLAVRGEVDDIEPGMVRDACRYRVLKLRVENQPLVLTLIDIKSDPLMSRRPAFEKLTELISRHPTLPHVIAGDFNTPPDSVLYKELRVFCTNAFEVAGSGYRETWPIVLPVLGLDQVWGDRRIKWHRCFHGWSARSDHRPVIAEFSLLPPA